MKRFLFAVALLAPPAFAATPGAQPKYSVNLGISNADGSYVLQNGYQYTTGLGYNPSTGYWIPFKVEADGTLDTTGGGTSGNVSGSGNAAAGASGTPASAGSVTAQTDPSGKIVYVAKAAPLYTTGADALNSPSGALLSVQDAYLMSLITSNSLGAYLPVSEARLEAAIGVANGSGTAPANTLNGCFYLAVAPSLANGSYVGQQCDQNGNVKVTGTVSVGNFPTTQAVSVASLPLPTGAATSANQPQLNPDGGSPAHIVNSPSVQPYTGTPSACTASTVGTTATLILDSVANGVGRAGGGLVLPLTATAAIEYQWSSSATGLTTTPGGLVFQLAPGSTVSFAGAPNTQLWAISTATQSLSCMVTK